MVQRIGILATKPMISRMIPRMIMRTSSVFRFAFYSRGRREGSK
jgi:hypothetical protein